MQKKIAIISPSADLSLSLEKVLCDSGFSVEVVNEYPTSDDLQRRIFAEQSLAAVLIDFANEHRALHLLRKLSRDQPELPLIVVNGSAKLSSVVETKTAGAWGYIPESHTNADIQSLAALLTSERAPENNEADTGTIVSFVPAQGGSGASTIALHIGASVADRQVGRSLLVDFDLHTGTAAFQLGLHPETTLLSALITQDLSEESLGRAIARKGNLEVLVGASGEETFTSEVFQLVPELLSRLTKTYRYVFVDLPPPLFSSSTDVLTKSARIYVVCTPEITSLHLAKRKIVRLEALGIPLDNVGILVNRATSWGAVDKSTLEAIVGLPVEWVIDNDYASVRQAALDGGLIADSSVLSGQFRQLAAEITERLDRESSVDTKSPRSAATYA